MQVTDTNHQHGRTNYLIRLCCLQAKNVKTTWKSSEAFRQNIIARERYARHETDGQNGGVLMSALNENNTPDVMRASEPDTRDDARVELQNNSTFSIIIFSCTFSIFLVD